MALRFSRTFRLMLKRLACLCIIFTLLHYFRGLDFTSRRYSTWPWTNCLESSSSFEQTCAASRSIIARKVQIVVKTGGSEPRSRLLYQLRSILSKVPHQQILILSDMDEQFDSYHAHDVYADLSAQERAGYPEFALYDVQQEYQQQGKDTGELRGGWDLAKYMNLAMKRKIWKMKQDIQSRQFAEVEWYVFIDTDTFVEWENMLSLLEHLDPAKQMYIGSPVWLPGLQFAHGGSAYILSQRAMEALNEPGLNDEKELLYSQYGLNTTELCCGDEALAKVLKSKGVKLRGYWPMFNGEVPATLSFGHDLWCEPLISLHHLSGEDMQRLWKWIEGWKRRWKGMSPFLFRDLFDYIAPELTTIREDWDNTHDSMKIYPKNRASHSSFENCRVACEKERSCFQFVYNGTTCALSNHIGLGREVSSEKNGARVVSGWNTDRIRSWTSQTVCSNAHWLHSNP